MAFYRLSGLRSLVSIVVVWVLVTAAAQDTYDEVYGDLDTETYQIPDEGLGTTLMLRKLRAAPPPLNARDLMLYKLIQSLVEGKKSNYRSKWSTLYQILSQIANVSDKDGVAMRLEDTLRGSGTTIDPKSQKPAKPEQIWKTKKGKAARMKSKMVCYFKLCAFRPPV